MELSKNELNWIKEVAPYIAAHVKAGDDMQTATTKGVADYSAILTEMCESKTDRAKVAVSLLSKKVWVQANLQSVSQRI